MGWRWLACHDGRHDRLPVRQRHELVEVVICMFRRRVERGVDLDSTCGVDDCWTCMVPNSGEGGVARTLSADSVWFPGDAQSVS